MSKEKETKGTEIRLTSEWINYLLFLGGLALVYIYLTHRTDNIVRDIDKAEKELVELRAENITLKSEIIQKRSRSNIEQRLEGRGVKEPNRAVQRIKVIEDEH
ncbi:MAG: hypothetical protein JXR19_09130 [Bacteroidia bacterium]